MAEVMHARERDSEVAMNETHEANRRYWDSTSDDWRGLRDEDGLLSRLCDELELAFDGGLLAEIRESVGELRGKDVCVIASGGTNGDGGVSFPGLSCPTRPFDAVDGLRRVTTVEAGAPGSVQGRHPGFATRPPRTSDRRSHARIGSVCQGLRSDVE